LGVLGIPAKAPTPQAISIATPEDNHRHQDGNNPMALTCSNRLIKFLMKY
jgi:hypothetical protein